MSGATTGGPAGSAPGGGDRTDSEPIAGEAVGNDRGQSRAAMERDAGEGLGNAVRVVLVTAPNFETGEFLARELVEERLVACGNVIPDLVSIYWWEDEIQRDEEVLVILKTRRDRIHALRERVEELHPYEVPEFLVFSVESAHEAYARWVADQSASTSAED